MAEQLGAEFAIPVASSDYHAALNDSAVDAVHICTPNAQHFSMAKEALQASKQVACEKPLATTVEDARELVALAAKTGLRNCVCHNPRYYPLVQQMRRMSEHRETIGWIPPRGGMTAFPWLLSGENSRAFCQAAAERGILLAPGDCFDEPSHFRLGFAAIGEKLPDALNWFGEHITGWSATNMARA